MYQITENYTLEDFIKEWEENKMDDSYHLAMILDHKDNLPEFEIKVDNDDVTLSFVELEDEEGECPFVQFWDNGYHLLPTMFKYLNMNADFV